MGIIAAVSQHLGVDRLAVLEVPAVEHPAGLALQQRDITAVGLQLRQGFSIGTAAAVGRGSPAAAGRAGP